ncbi:MAG: sugar ABC transporter permease [Chloroflexi bacterium]|nr:MAG: sugar ABC transporter permease [Chloroflexota bacterium]
MAEVERSVSDVARTTAVARARAQLSPRERIGRLLENEAVFGYLMVAPAILYILILVGYPFAIALWFTVSDATVSQPIGPFTGLTNLKFVLDDEVFKRALANTFVFTISSQLIQMVFGTMLAFLLLRHFRGRRLIRAIVMLPFTVPVAVGAIAWQWMLNPTYSVVNWVGAQLGFFPMLGGPNWLGEEQYAMISIIVVNVWRNLPFTAIVLTAGISSIPQEILEAASLDGAGWLTRWRKIMAPIIAPIIYIALLFSLVFTFTDMTVVWLLTKGSPVNSTHVIASYAFVTGVISGGLGRGAAMSLFLFPVLLVGALMLLRNLKARTLD